MPRKFSRRAGIALLLAVCIISAACADGSVSQGSDGTSAPQSSTASSASTVHSSEPVESDTATVPDIPPTVEALATSEPEMSDEIHPETEETTTAFPTEDIPAEATHEPPRETAEPQVTSPPETTPAVTTTTVPPEPEKPPVEEKPPAVVIIPEVKTVSSPQTAAAVTDTAVLDYSNASCGYISASYNGRSAKAKLRIICGDVTYDHDLAADGTIEYYPLSQGSGDYSVQIYQQIEGRSYSPVFDGAVTFTAAITDENAMYLYPNRYVEFVKSSDCVRKAAELCAGADGTIEKLAAIFGYITDNITYDYALASTVKSGYTPLPDDVLAKRSGICFDYASLFAAMARSQGIPTRLVIGYATDIYHAWNEVYTEETGWISAEILLARSGYNLVDSTFYAGAEDKEAMAEYITNSTNYSTVFRY